MRAVVVGAGMAGAACAAALLARGHEVTVLEEGGAAGGRMAQRRAEGFVFDHGAQYIKVRDAAFAAAVEAWQERGVVMPWPGADTRGAPAWQGVPSMAAPVRALLAGCRLETGVRVGSVRREDGGWLVADRYGASVARGELLALAVPAPQAARLLEGVCDAGVAALAARLGPVAIAPCWSGMLGFAERVRQDFESLRPESGPLAWIARNTGRPGRGGHESWTVHAVPAWSRQRLGRPAGEVAGELLQAFLATVGGPLPAVRHLAAVCWPHALVERPLGRPFVLDAAAGIGLCGDWCLGPRVEAAWLSGTGLGTALAGVALAQA